MFNLSLLAGAAVVLPLSYFIVLPKGNRHVKALLMFFLVFIGVAGSFLLDNVQSIHAVKAVESVKQWIQSPEKKNSSEGIEKAETEIIPIKNRVLLQIPVISQLPELPRGCEVTTLSMLLQYQGVNVDKLQLAKELKKNPATYKSVNGKVYFGDPNEGFVGNMYTYNEPGFGVYHGPIKELGERYLPGKIKDLTGADFQELKIHLSDDRPIWVIINTQYKKLDAESFQTWHTPKGTIQVTYREHSVLLTGYDKNFVYFNDPLTGEKNKKAPMQQFEEAWVQMGRQAITYLPR